MCIYINFARKVENNNKNKNNLKLNINSIRCIAMFGVITEHVDKNWGIKKQDIRSICIFIINLEQFGLVKLVSIIFWTPK